MRFAYADPPYLGCCKLYAHRHEEPYGCWDYPEAHWRLVEKLQADYPDGWAMSLHTPSLRVLLPMVPEKCRIAAWVKPFAVFKPNVNPAYSWEPVMFMGGRKRDRTQPTVRDWHAENITLKKGLTGAKPPKFADWILGLLGVDFSAGDTIDDLFPGTHGLTLAWKERSEPSEQLVMEATNAA